MSADVSGRLKRVGRYTFFLALQLTAASAAADGLSRAAVLRYRAQPKDFAVFEEGLKSAKKVQEDIFPNGLRDFGAVLYDSKDLFLYSPNKNLPLKKYKSWEGYQVYTAPLKTKLKRGNLDGCKAGHDFIIKALARKADRHYFSCAASTTFLQIQKDRDTIYATRESYLATMIHEFAHLYQDAQGSTEPVVEELAALLDAEGGTPSSSDLGQRILREGYAQWAEAQAAKKLFPTYFKALKKSVRPKAEDEHGVGLRLVFRLSDKVP